MSSLPSRLRFRLFLTTTSCAGSFPPATRRFRRASTTWRTTSLHSSSALAALPHHARDTIKRRNPFLPGFRRDSPAASAGNSFAHHARHFIFRATRSLTGISFHGRDALIHSPTSTGRTSVIAGKLPPVFFGVCQHSYHSVSNNWLTHRET